jgi:hypothetical protein
MCYVIAVAVFFLLAFPCRADVLFIHDYNATEYLMGNQEADLLVGYTNEAMFVDKNTRFKGKLMTTLFGKVHEGRETAHFLLDKDQIREMDYHKGKILVFSFEKLSDVNWIKQKQKISEAEEKIIRDRYRVSEPLLSVKIFPGREEVSGYPCQVVEANLRLETVDIIRNSSSVTLVKQKLWVSDAVPGYGQYHAFHEKLAKRLGFDAARLGGLSGVLRYWDGSLDPIRKAIKDVKGYPVRSLLHVEGIYTAGVGTDAAKSTSAILKEESVVLREALTDKPVRPRFPEPSNFGTTVVQ